METNAARRKRKLVALCADKGGYRAVAQTAAVNAATLDQILKGVLLPARRDGTAAPRALGDSLARKIERAYELPEGWFDVEDAQAMQLSVEEIEVILALRARRATGVLPFPDRREGPSKQVGSSFMRRTTDRKESNNDEASSKPNTERPGRRSR